MIERKGEVAHSFSFYLVLYFLCTNERVDDGQRGDVNASIAASVCRTSWENYWVLVSVINQADIVYSLSLSLTLFIS